MSFIFDYVKWLFYGSTETTVITKQDTEQFLVVSDNIQQEIQNNNILNDIKKFQFKKKPVNTIKKRMDKISLLDNIIDEIKLKKPLKKVIISNKKNNMLKQKTILDEIVEFRFNKKN